MDLYSVAERTEMRRQRALAEAKLALKLKFAPPGKFDKRTELALAIDIARDFNKAGNQAQVETLLAHAATLI